MVDIGSQRDLLVLYEKEVRRSCGINLSSDPIARVPRISNRNLPSSVRSNIARLQNVQNPLVKKANRELEQLTKELSKCAAQEPRPVAEAIDNPFKRKFPETSTTNGHKLFVAAPPQKSTITLGQYRQRSIFGTFSSSDESSDATSTEVPSDVVPLRDLNIASDDLFSEVLSGPNQEPQIVTPLPLISPLANTSSSSSLFSEVSNQSVNQLPDHLLDDESDGSSPLNIGLDTEDELLRSDAEEVASKHAQLWVRIDRSHLRFDRFLIDRPSPSCALILSGTEQGDERNNPRRTASTSSFSSISSAEQFSSDGLPPTDREDIGRLTPRRPAQNIPTL